MVKSENTDWMILVLRDLLAFASANHLNETANALRLALDIAQEDVGHDPRRDANSSQSSCNLVIAASTHSGRNSQAQ